jgi:hypothetical protein
LLPSVSVTGRRTGIYGVVGDTSFGTVAGARVTVLGFRSSSVLTDSAGREKLGAVSVCAVPRVRWAVNHNPGVLNGVLNLLPEEICRWNANEIALVEFGPLIFWEAR